MLLNFGACSNRPNDTGIALFSAAVNDNNEEIAAGFITAGTNSFIYPFGKHSEGCRSLQKAAGVGTLELLNHTLLFRNMKSNAVPRESRLFYLYLALVDTTIINRIGAMHLLLGNGAPLVYRGYTLALHYAGQLSFHGGLGILLGTGADSNTVNDMSGEIALYRTNNAAIAERLIVAGTDPNSRDHDGYTLLHRACMPSNCAVAYVLLRWGADATSRSCSMPLTFLEIVQSMVEQGLQNSCNRG